MYDMVSEKIEANRSNSRRKIYTDYHQKAKMRNITEITEIGIIEWSK